MTDDSDFAGTIPQERLYASLPHGIVPPATHSHKPTFGLLVIGDELLSGRRADQHVPKAIELLAARGLELGYVHMVGDDRERIAAQLRLAFDSNDVVLSCGGIGATPDDHTRQSAAAALGVPLELHPVGKALILERMQEMAVHRNQHFDPQSPDNVHRLQMAMFPRGAQIVPNPYNKIAGFSCGHVHFFPGFPVMAWPMMEWVLDSLYPMWQGARSKGEYSVIVKQAYEATLTPLMVRIESAYPGVKVFSLPSVSHPEYGMHIELGVKGSEAYTEQAFDTLHAELKRLGYELGPERRK